MFLELDLFDLFDLAEGINSEDFATSNLPFESFVIFK
jgi:hypothetical protein